MEKISFKVRGYIKASSVKENIRPFDTSLLPGHRILADSLQGEEK
jgi:hypothetical protein